MNKTSREVFNENDFVYRYYNGDIYLVAKCGVWQVNNKIIENVSVEGWYGETNLWSDKLNYIPNEKTQPYIFAKEPFLSKGVLIKDSMFM